MSFRARLSFRAQRGIAVSGPNCRFLASLGMTAGLGMTNAPRTQPVGSSVDVVAEWRVLVREAFAPERRTRPHRPGRGPMPQFRSSSSVMSHQSSVK